MILNLKRWIEHYQDEDNIFNPPLIPNGEYVEKKLRMDSVQMYGKEDDELVICIGGTEFFFEYDEEEHNKLESYFNLLNTNEN
jgi:hypothetical protein